MGEIMKIDKKSLLIKILFAFCVSIAVCFMSVSSILNTDHATEEAQPKVIILKEHTVIPTRKSDIQENKATELKNIVEERSYHKNKINLKYPQLKGIVDQELQKECNELIENLVLEKAKTMMIEDSYQLDYKITEQTDSMISIVMSGMISLENSLYPTSVLYTLNIDLEQSRIWKLEYIQEIEQIAENLIRGKDLPMYDLAGNRLHSDWQKAVEEYLKQQTIQSLSEDLKHFDLRLDGEAEPLGFSYYENGKLHICISVPHALGDYVDIIPDRTIQVGQ